MKFSLEKLTKSLAVSAFFSTNIFFFCPAFVYFTNTNEFTFSFTGLIPYFILIILSTIIILSAILMSLKNSVFQKAVSLVFSISFLLWLQGNILVWNYGPLDGSKIHWDDKYLQIQPITLELHMNCIDFIT